jgi:hypothetical protein
MGAFDFITDTFNSVKHGFESAYNGIKHGVGDAFGGIKNTLGSVFGGLKNIAVGTWNKVIKPVGSKVYDVGEKIVGKAVSMGEKALDRFDKVNDSAAGALQGLGSFLSSPLAYIGIGLVAIIVLPKLLK